MSDQKFEFLVEDLEKAEYNTLRMKAIRNEMILQDDADGSIIRVPARDVFISLYNKPIPTY